MTNSVNHTKTPKKPTEAQEKAQVQEALSKDVAATFLMLLVLTALLCVLGSIWLVIRQAMMGTLLPSAVFSVTVSMMTLTFTLLMWFIRFKAIEANIKSDNSKL
jgi:predicted small integral membrane protein